MEGLRQELYGCKCYDSTCIMQVTTDLSPPDEKYIDLADPKRKWFDHVWFETQLSTGGFWYRCKEALRYVFRIRPYHTFWGGPVLTKEDAIRLRDQLDEVI